MNKYDSAAPNVPSMKGGKWTVCRVSEILSNEKYAGNALLQKEFIADHLTKKKLPNKGSLAMYFAEGTHDAIISPEIYERVREIRESKTRNVKSHTPTERYPFSGIIRCPKCGKSYRRRICRGKAVWNCSTLLSYGKGACFGKQIPEDTLYSLSTGVLGLNEFDPTVFSRLIDSLTVSAPNEVTYSFKDGHEVTVNWSDHSRRDSWTEEMRREAGEKMKARKQECRQQQGT